MEDSTRSGNNLEMRPSGRIESPMLVIVDEFSKSPKREEGEERKEWVENLDVANEKVMEGTMENSGGGGETFGEDRRYPTKERWPPGKW